VARTVPLLMLMFAIVSAAPVRGFAQGHTMSGPAPVGGNAENLNPGERRLFERMLCMCGTCARLPLATCTCDFAGATRASMRERLAQGTAADDIVNEYVARYGVAALSVPPDAGHNRAVWFLPVSAIALGALGAIALVRRWRAKSRASATVLSDAATADPSKTVKSKAEYDRRLDEELRGLDE